ncbi:ArsR family transcriptional regulator [Streptomyces sp. NPDC006283]|uniref:ArsR/SmtB family transcription factor n=1 Tax=Streptomyces sp. NPDC006283 TaxID=3156741 RepID=UPI0033A2CE7E
MGRSERRTLTSVTCGFPSRLHTDQAIWLNAFLAPANFSWQEKGVRMNLSDLTGDELTKVLAALSNPHRLRVVAAVARERNYVSRLARDLRISRALLQVHLRKLESAGLVSSTLEVSEDGKAMKYYEVVPFALNLTPGSVIALAETITIATDEEAGQAKGER